MYTIYRIHSYNNWECRESRRTIEAAISCARCASAFSGIKHAVIDLDGNVCHISHPEKIKAEDAAILQRRDSNTLVG